MATSRAHLTALPQGFIIVRIMQLLFTAATLSLSIFMIVEDGNFAQYVVMITVHAHVPKIQNIKRILLTTPKAAFTLITLIWIILASYITPRAYNYWAILAMEILFFAAWVNGFIFSFASGFNPDDGGCLYTYNNSTQAWELLCKVISDESLFSAAGHSSFAVLGLAGGLMVLWLVSMIVVSVFIARHRREGGHCRLGSGAPICEK
jgi:hypothetical protein